jgi:hypothetical protein
MAELRQADPRARRTALVIVGAGILVGVLLLVAADSARPTFEAWVNADLPTRSRLVAAALILLMTGPAIAMSVYLWRLGTRAVRSQQFPPPGLRVARDTPVVTGDAAARAGRWIRTLAAALGAAGVLLGLLLWRLLSRLAAVAGA